MADCGRLTEADTIRGDVIGDAAWIFDTDSIMYEHGYGIDSIGGGDSDDDGADLDFDSDPDRRVGYAIGGYPGAGKSTAGEMLATHIDGINIETGDVVRREASEHFECPASDLSSDELGEYSTMRRETDGGDYVAQDVIEVLDAEPRFPNQPAVITGMRDSEVPKLFAEYFDSFVIVFIEAAPPIRLQRLQSRGRQDEDQFTIQELAERDNREDKWGTGDIKRAADMTLLNEGTLDEIAAKLAAVPVFERETRLADADQSE